MSRPPIVQQLQERADALGLPEDHEMRTVAADLDAAVTDFAKGSGEDTLAYMVGLWARARRLLWIDEPPSPPTQGAA